MTYLPPNQPAKRARAYIPFAGRPKRPSTLLGRALAKANKLLLTTALLLGACDETGENARRPQDPIDRPYRIEQVQFGGGPDVTLAGELTMPRTGSGFRAVILISGSGPQNRNEALAGHRPFLVLSDHLTRAGYAVLRYDDRGVAGSTGTYETADLNDFTDDAVGAYRFLQARPEIDQNGIGFIGHSEGGYIATEAALRADPAFAVFMAGAARRLLPDVLVTQNQDLLTAHGVDQDQIDVTLRQLREGSEILAQPGPLSKTRERLETYLNSQGIPMRERRQVLQDFATPWGVSYARYDPGPSLRALSMPVLALFGEKDLQVSARQEAPVMRAALRNPTSRVDVITEMNHLFQPAETGLPSEYAEIDTTISPRVLARITTWLNGLWP